jgi:hypothetical protein
VKLYIPSLVLPESFPLHQHSKLHEFSSEPHCQSSANLKLLKNKCHYNKYISLLGVQNWDSFKLCSTSRPHLEGLKSSNHLPIGKKKKAKVIPITGHRGPKGPETSRIPRFLDNRLRDGGATVSLRRQPPFTPGIFLELISVKG